MPTVLIQQPLAPDELKALKSEFIQYKFCTEEPDNWADVEVLFGERLTAEQLEHETPRLRWIHIPSPTLGEMPLHEIGATSNLLVTNSKEQDVHQAGEYVLGSILVHAKNLLEPHNTVWSLRGRILLQIGLGHIGSAVLEHARRFSMRTWGLQERPSFHPHCEKTYPLEQLNALLPAVDVLSIAIPRGEPVPHIFDAHRLDLLDSDAILVIVGSSGIIDEKALKKHTFRGVVQVSPQVACAPELEERFDYRLFRFNFRRYITGDFDTMRNIVRIS